MVWQRDNRRALYDAGQSDKQIARAIGHHRTSVREWRVRNGLPANRKRHNQRPAGIDPRFSDLLAANLHDAEIARRLGREHGVIRKWRIRLTVERKDHFAEHGLSQEDGRRKLYDVGARDDEIALMAGKSPASIRCWRETRGLPINNCIKNEMAMPRMVIVSIDETTGRFSGPRRHDCIADQTHSSWLEEMGATVW